VCVRVCLRVCVCVCVCVCVFVCLCVGGVLGISANEYELGDMCVLYSLECVGL
jgi:hypothetical protein